MYTSSLERDSYSSLSWHANAMPCDINHNKQISCEKRVESALTRTFTNPLFWAAAAASAYVYSCSQVILPAIFAPSYVVPVVGIITSAIAYCILHRREEIWQELSLESVVSLERWHQITGYRWYDHINDHLILGAMPLVNLAHADQLINMGIGAILSLVVDEEIALSKCIPEDAWRRLGIESLRIPIPDCSPPTLTHIRAALKFIRRQQQSGKITYVYCKTGIGRSATIAACYVLKHELLHVETFNSDSDIANRAVSYIRSKRPQVLLTSTQREIVKEYALREL